MAELAIAINSRLRDVISRGHLLDLDYYSLRLADKIASDLDRGYPPRDALSKGVQETPTQFFRVNKLTRTEFIERCGPPLFRLRPSKTLLDYVMQFKRFAERQLVRKLRATPDEETLRSFLQTFLAGNYLTYREVESGVGRSDILCVEPFKELIETKLWKGPRYFDDGLTELATYLGTEDLASGYYLNEDFGGADEFIGAKGSDQWVESRLGKRLHVVFIRLPRVPPSKLGREARKSNRT